MSQPERSILSVSERAVTGSSLMGSEESTRIRIEASPLKEGGTRYSVTSPIEVGRAAISSIMATPVHYSAEDWTAVRDGLRDIAYPSRRVNRAQRNSAKRSHLRSVGPASRELAVIMTGNVDYRSQTANVPVFSVHESVDYTNEEILRRTSAGKLLNMLKGIGLDAATARQLSEFTYFSSQSEEVIRELRAITGFSEGELQVAENLAMLDRVDKRVWSELVNRLQEKMFIGFVHEAIFKNGKFEFGGSDNSVFILEDDVPKNIVESDAGVSVEINRRMRDPDRRTGHDRYEVAFLTKGPRLTAQPKLVWDKIEDKRQLAYPVSTYQPASNDVVKRQSSILGAAIAANYGRLKYGIPYSSALTNRLFPRKDRMYSFNWAMIPNGAGMLPLVLDHHQDQLLSDEYFASIEDAIDPK